MRILLLTILCALILGCNSQRKALNSWVGRTKPSLVMQWGPPAREDSDGEGGEIVIYAKEASFPSDTVRYYNYVVFYLNSENRIYNWLTKREQVSPDQIDTDVYRLE